MGVRVVEGDSQFHAELSSHGNKLVVVDFTASWCGPCQHIAPIFEQLSGKYNRAAFLKVDVGTCAETAASQGVSVMPTFIFYRNMAKIDRMQGADPATLERKIQLHYGSGDDDEDIANTGHRDLSMFIVKNQCECLNESDSHPFSNCLDNSPAYLESDDDEQLIISVTFSQAVKLHSLKVKAASDNGPKSLRLFINQPNTMDFSSAATYQPVQELELKPADLTGTPVPLRYVKFQNVLNVQIFVKDNQSDAETTRIDQLVFIGSPIGTTNMGEFKRVAGKKGESH